MRLFLLAVWTVILAEIACGVRSAVLTAVYHHPLTIWLGTMAGTAVVMTLAVLLGNSFNYNPPWLRVGGGSFFILYGILLMKGMV